MGKGLGYTPAITLEMLIIKKLGKKVVGITSEIDKLRKESKREEIAEQKEKLLIIGENIKEIESRKEDISYLEILYNSRIELVKSKEGIYIKAPEKV